MSFGLANRHAFEALGRDLDLDRFTTTLPAMSAYRDTFSGGTGGQPHRARNVCRGPDGGDGVGPAPAVHPGRILALTV